MAVQRLKPNERAEQMDQTAHNDIGQPAIAGAKDLREGCERLRRPLRTTALAFVDHVGAQPLVDTVRGTGPPPWDVSNVTSVPPPVTP
jgi:hypothetical protein